MKRRLSMIGLGLALAVAPGFAREPQGQFSPAASAGEGPNGGSIFVGHYGDVIAIPSDWTADAEMRGETEIVYFYRKFLDEFGFRPFQPKRSDYKPDNFTPMGLINLHVFPKDARRGFGNLAAIRGAQELQLKHQGVDYKIFDETGKSDWPRATFHVKTSTPYRLWHTYSESPSEFYMLTFGGAVEAGEFGLDQWRIDDIDSAVQLISRSLSESLRAAERRTLAGKLFKFQDEAAHGMFYEFNDFIRDDYYRSLPAVRFVAAAAAVMLILALWPGATAGARRARLSGRSMMFFTLFAWFAGFLAVYLPARLAGALWRADELASMIPVLLLPVIGWAAARGLRSSRVGKVSIAMAAIAAFWAFAILWRADMENLDSAPVLAIVNTFFHLFIGQTFGIAFAAVFGPLTDKEVPR